MMGNELFDILKNFVGFQPMLYNELVILDHQSDFNENEFNRFIVGYSSLSKEGITLEEYQRYLSNISRVNPDKLDRLKQDLKKNNSGWIGILGKTAKPKENLLKMYLSIDNHDLHYFANALIASLLEKKYDDFDFKINNEPEINRRDSVVIYCNDENFGKYVTLVQDIIKKHPEIHFHSPNLLGAPYDEHIYCGRDPGDGKTSHTEKICNELFEALEHGEKIEDIVNKVKIEQQRMSHDLHALAERTQKRILEPSDSDMGQNNDLYEATDYDDFDQIYFEALQAYILKTKQEKDSKKRK